MNIAVIGTGYVGLVSGTCFAEMGNQVVCVDNNQDKLKKLQDAELTIYEPGLEILFLRNIAKKRLSFTDDLRAAILKSEIIFLCLPTPQDEDGSADLKYVFGIAEEIGSILEQSADESYKVIVNKSTVPVGTADAVRKILEKYKIKSGFDVVSNPEFLKEGFAVEDFMKPDRIIVGAKLVKSFDIMHNLYEPFVRQGNPIIAMNPESAEVTKYAANSYLATRITFMNELANFCEKSGADIDLVRKGMGTDARIGKRFLFAGIGYGGSCFPKDVNAMINTSKEFGAEMKILSVVDEVNKNQKLVLVDKVMNYFNGDVSGKQIAVWGLAFKPNTDDVREAPSLVIIKSLLEKGAVVSAYDPAAMGTSKHFLDDTITYAENEYEALRNCDALLILTEWNEFRNPDFSLMKNNMKERLIFDGRNIFTTDKMREEGFIYFSIGRKELRP